MIRSDPIRKICFEIHLEIIVCNRIFVILPHIRHFFLKRNQNFATLLAREGTAKQRSLFTRYDTICQVHEALSHSQCIVGIALARIWKIVVQTSLCFREIEPCNIPKILLFSYKRVWTEYTHIQEDHCFTTVFVIMDSKADIFI